jgi:hypothetical protein
MCRAAGAAGHITHIVLNPLTRKVTDVVVREPGLLSGEVIVPIGCIAASTPEAVDLRITRQELADMPSFIVTRFITPSDNFLAHYQPWTDYPSAGVMMSPYASMWQEGITVSYQTIPIDELAMSRGDSVEATDGRVGRIDEFLVDPTTMRITHLVMRTGHVWGQKDITIPLVQIDRITDGSVYLRLNKRQIEQLPALKVRRWGR